MEDEFSHILCTHCKHDIHCRCVVRHKFREDGKSKSEFIKIVGGVFQKCDYYEKKGSLI